MKNVNVAKKIKKTTKGTVKFVKKGIMYIMIGSALGASVVTLIVVAIFRAI